MKKLKNDIIDMTGKKLGRLTVLSYYGTIKGRAIWSCQCDCGNVKTISGKYLRSGKTKSCGCLHKESIASINASHGMSKSITYMCWSSMKNRCYNQKQQCYSRYGGLGIKVCSRWLDSFDNFLDDMGERPKGTTLDRINPLIGYEPNNCRWATPKEQGNNKRGQLAIKLLDALVTGDMTINEVIESWSPADVFEAGYTKLEE